MSLLCIPCETGEVSDGYHTFDELYEHRHMLLMALFKRCPDLAWISATHSNGKEIDGWFIAGMNLPSGAISYHLPVRLWSLACIDGVTVLPFAPPWDGHMSKDVLERLRRFIEDAK